MSVYNYIVIAFSASELCLLLFKRSKTGLKENNADKRSLLYLWITIPTCLTLAGFISGYRHRPCYYWRCGNENWIGTRRHRIRDPVDSHFRPG